VRVPAPSPVARERRALPRLRLPPAAAADRDDAMDTDHEPDLLRHQQQQQQRPRPDERAELSCEPSDALCAGLARLSGGALARINAHLGLFAADARAPHAALARAAALWLAADAAAGATHAAGRPRTGARAAHAQPLAHGGTSPAHEQPRQHDAPSAEGGGDARRGAWEQRAVGAFLSRLYHREAPALGGDSEPHRRRRRRSAYVHISFA
jgi:hypothetical protein